VKLLRLTTWCALAMLSVASVAFARQQRVRHQTFDAFINGEAQNIAVLTRGAIELGPELKPYDGMEPRAFIWALIADSRKRVYAATGHDGQVLRVDQAKATTVLKTEDLMVLSLAVDKDDNLYAGCAPSGRIYRIAKDGQASVFCETEQAYVWSLAFADSGHLYAATGPNGKVLRISPDGRQVDTVYQSKEQHILCLVASGKEIYAGTSNNGLVYKITPDGQVSVAFDSPHSEIRCITADEKGHVYFASADGILPQPARAPGAPPPPPSPQKSGGRQGAAAEPASEGNQKPAPSSKPSMQARRRPRAGGRAVVATNTVFRLSADGRTVPLFSMRGVAFITMVWHDGALYCGTAGEGQIFRIRSEQDAAVWASLEQPEVLSLCPLPDGRWFVGSGNDGRVFSSSAGLAESGIYESEVLDAKYRSTWGAMNLATEAPRGTKVEVSTRSGNVEKPDDTWSRWTPPQGGEGRRPITSPSARFVQYRLMLSTRDTKITPVVESVDFPYLADNQAPSVTAIDITSNGDASNNKKNNNKQAASNSAESGDHGVASGTIKATWQAGDPNNDPMEFALYFRGRDEKNWKLLKDDLTAKTFTWDTQAVPDGVYELRVVAGDRPANPPPRAMTGERISRAFVVDNTPPVVKITRTQIAERACEVQAEVQDAGSALSGARYSVNAGPWKPLLPVDGIFDRQAETMTLKTEPLEPGEHTLVIQAEDSAGNVGTAKTVFQIPQ
jgi:hypothetical protein